jgi:hypothetical protein
MRASHSKTQMLGTLFKPIGSAEVREFEFPQAYKIGIFVPISIQQVATC